MQGKSNVVVCGRLTVDMTEEALPMQMYAGFKALFGTETRPLLHISDDTTSVQARMKRPMRIRMSMQGVKAA